MTEKREEYIDQLLDDLKRLEERLLSVKENGALPFSFFSASFDRIERISRSLHELELMQIGEMKSQMERLVQFLSESDPRNGAAEISDVVSESDPRNGAAEISDVVGKNDEAPAAQEVGVKIVLPEYKDPRTNPAVPLHIEPVPDLPEINGTEKSVTQHSLNDVIQAPTVLQDLKRGISLNDRFLFQRELFGNNRSEMDSVMNRLNAFDNFEDVENYLSSGLGWDFEDRTVKEFLLIIKKGLV